MRREDGEREERRAIKICSIRLKMKNGESYWIEDFRDIKMGELEDTIEAYLIANPEISREEIEFINLTTYK